MQMLLIYRCSCEATVIYTYIATFKLMDLDALQWSNIGDQQHWYVPAGCFFICITYLQPRDSKKSFLP